jgi:hypothetical protein
MAHAPRIQFLLADFASATKGVDRENPRARRLHLLIWMTEPFPVVMSVK